MDLLLHHNMYYAKLKALLSRAKTDEEIYETIVNTPFLNKRKTVSLGLGVVVLLLVNEKTKTIDRIALSNTESAQGAVRMSAKPFKQITIPVSHKSNIIAQAIAKQFPQATSDWKDLFEPALSAEQARFNQAGAGIGCSVVYPLPNVPHGGALIFSYYVPLEKMTDQHHEFMRRYAKISAQRLTLNTA